MGWEGPVPNLEIPSFSEVCLWSAQFEHFHRSVEKQSWNIPGGMYIFSAQFFLKAPKWKGETEWTHFKEEIAYLKSRSPMFLIPNNQKPSSTVTKLLWAAVHLLSVCSSTPELLEFMPCLCENHSLSFSVPQERLPSRPPPSTDLTFLVIQNILACIR